MTNLKIITNENQLSGDIIGEGKENILITNIESSLNRAISIHFACKPLTLGISQAQISLNFHTSSNSKKYKSINLFLFKQCDTIKDIQNYFKILHTIFWFLLILIFILIIGIVVYYIQNNNEGLKEGLLKYQDFIKQKLVDLKNKIYSFFEKFKIALVNKIPGISNYENNKLSVHEEKIKQNIFSKYSSNYGSIYLDAEKDKNASTNANNKNNNKHNFSFDDKNTNRNSRSYCNKNKNVNHSNDAYKKKSYLEENISFDVLSLKSSITSCNNHIDKQKPQNIQKSNYFEFTNQIEEEKTPLNYIQSDKNISKDNQGNAKIFI